MKYCVGTYVDIHGMPKGKFVPIDHFEDFAAGLEGIRENLDPRPAQEDNLYELSHDEETIWQFQRYLSGFVSSVSARR